MLAGSCLPFLSALSFCRSKCPCRSCCVCLIDFALFMHLTSPNFINFFQFLQQSICYINHFDTTVISSHLTPPHSTTTSPSSPDLHTTAMPSHRPRSHQQQPAHINKPPQNPHPSTPRNQNKSQMPTRSLTRSVLLQKSSYQRHLNRRLAR